LRTSKLIVTADHETGDIRGPDANLSFDPIANNDAGVMPGYNYYGDIGGSNRHFNSLVPLFAKGDAAKLFKSFATNTDLVFGAYIDNTDIFKILQSCLPAKVNNGHHKGNGAGNFESDNDNNGQRNLPGHN
jgi:alkaline phosphatase